MLLLNTDLLKYVQEFSLVFDACVLQCDKLNYTSIQIGTYDLCESVRTDDVTINNILLFHRKNK